MQNMDTKPRVICTPNIYSFVHLPGQGSSASGSYQDYTRDTKPVHRRAKCTPLCPVIYTLGQFDTGTQDLPA